MQEVVIWSGGCDSTKILYDLARNSSANKPVLAISVEHSRTDDLKRKKEEEARKKILKWMKEEGYHIEHETIKVTPDLMTPTGFNEPSCWVCSVVPYLPSFCNVHFGYIFEDSFWHLKGEFTDTFHSITSLRINKYDIKLFFDLEWTHKKEIIKELKEIGLFKLIWTCERPKKNGNMCGKCIPCKSLKTNLQELKKEE